ncbi:MAG: acyltransferase [Prevotella sp.]|nr:acyltransferase [Prevotella sp.]MCM1074324.1 acyltransferase [Ruminococcus sp.]
MLKSLQSLRGIFTLFIFLGHFPFQYQELFQSPSDCAVSFFFILSGFVLYKAHADKIETGNYSQREFMTNRLIRIYPLHLLCLSFTLLLIYFCRTDCHPTAAQLIPNILLIQSWFPSWNIHFALNGVSWFLSSLMFCYLFFIPVARLSVCSPHTFIYIIGITAIAYFVYIHIIPADKLNWGIYILPPARLADFFIGMAACRLFSRLDIKSPKLFNALEVGAIILTLAMIIAAPRLPERYTLCFWWWVPLTILIVIFARADCEKPTIIRSLLESKPLIALGNISFSVFMLHNIVNTIIINIIIRVCPIIDTWGQMTLSLVLCLVAGAVCNKYFVLPATRFLNAAIRTAKK